MTATGRLFGRVLRFGHDGEPAPDPGITATGRREQPAPADATALQHGPTRCYDLGEAATRGGVRCPRRVKELLQAGLDLRDRHAAGQVSDHGLAVARGRPPAAPARATAAGAARGAGGAAGGPVGTVGPSGAVCFALP